MAPRARVRPSLRRCLRAGRIGHAQQRGLALITVMWLIGLLTLLATAMLAMSRSHARMSARAAQMVAAEAAEDSALRLALLQITGPIRENQQLGFSTQWRLRVFDRDIDIRVEREAGRVDLNASDAALLAAVFVAGGIDAGTARSYAARILDWRDPDDRLEPGGAERDDYRRAHLDYPPRNGPFESIGELRQVLGLADLSPQMLDAFTVYSTRSPLIDLSFAHPLVRIALQSQSSPQSVATGGEQLLGQVARIHACAAKDVIRSCKAVIARLTGDPKKPFLIYAWYTE